MESFDVMKVNVLKRSKNELRIEIEGEGHSFCNALQKLLLEDNSIEFSGYRVPHRLISHPIIYLRTKGSRKPEEALIDASKALSSEVKEVRKAFEEALQKTGTG